MKILGIACSLPDFVSSCFGTFARLSREGNRTGIIMVTDEETFPERIVYDTQHTVKSAGISETYFVKGFDYSSVSQSNADAIRSHVDQFVPDIVFMPSWKSADAKNAVLANTSLISCRGIGSVLMYGRELSEVGSRSVLRFRLSMEDAAPKYNSIQEYNSIIAQSSGTLLQDPAFRSAEDVEPTRVRNLVYDELSLTEPFECHRVILLDD